MIGALEQEISLPCTGCGGELRAVLGWRRLVRPEMVCLACGERWIDAEATTAWRIDADEDDTSRIVRRHFAQQMALVIFGVVSIPILLMVWWQLEHLVVLVEPPAIENLFQGVDFRGERSTARLFVPMLTVSWVLMLAWMVRRRESSMVWAFLTGLWCLLAFLLALGLATSGVMDFGS